MQGSSVNFLFHLLPMPEKLLPKSGGGGVFWERWGKNMDVSLEARWLVERLEAVGYIAIVVLASFGGQREMRSYAFA